MSLPTPDRSADLEQRYGTPSRAGRLLVLGLVAALAVAGMAWVAWTTVVHSRPDVTSQLLGYDVRGQHSATVTFSVARRSADVRASCELEAFAADHAVVGELHVPVTSGPAHAQVASTVRTERLATSVDLVGCTTSDQHAPQ